MLPVDHIYCLNLDRRTDRWEHAKLQFNRLGLEVERFSAVEPTDKGPLKSVGEYGCLLSHINVIKDAQSRGFKRIAIFEDDVVFHNNFEGPKFPDWEIIYLGASQTDWVNVPIKNGAYYHPRKTYGTFALLIDHRAFPKILAAYEALTASADQCLVNVFTDDPKAFVVYPNVCACNVSDSDIRQPMNQTNFWKKCRWKEEDFWKPSWLDQITFGITHFDRPFHLQTLVRSIKERYPKAKIVVADNSVLERPTIDGVELLECEPDCGLSACRNALVKHTKTPYLLLLEEDFVFTDETDIRRFYDVLKGNPKIGVIGGSLYANGHLHHYATRIIEEDGQIKLEDTASKWQITEGTCFRLCDQVFNFFLCRTEVPKTNPWDDSIKIGGEHLIWFSDLKTTDWLVAHTPMVSAIHDLTKRSDHYKRHRIRALKIVKDVLPTYQPYGKLWTVGHGKPNIIVFGVGHSGTSILTEMLTKFGWQVNNNDPNYFEDAEARALNISILRGQKPDLLTYLKQLPKPWVIKDPRMIVTIDEWMKAFCQLDNPPLLLGITKDKAKVLESYKRRGYKGDKSHGGFSVDELFEIYRKKFDLWPWSKLEVSYEQIAEAVKLFSPR